MNSLNDFRFFVPQASTRNFITYVLSCPYPVKFDHRIWVNIMLMPINGWINRIQIQLQCKQRRLNPQTFTPQWNQRKSDAPRLSNELTRRGEWAIELMNVSTCFFSAMKLIQIDLCHLCSLGAVHSCATGKKRADKSFRMNRIFGKRIRGMPFAIVETLGYTKGTPTQAVVNADSRWIGSSNVLLSRVILFESTDKFGWKFDLSRQSDLIYLIQLLREGENRMRACRKPKKVPDQAESTESWFQLLRTALIQCWHISIGYSYLH